MLECLLPSRAVASLRKGVLSGALRLLTLYVIGLVLFPGRRNGLLWERLGSWQGCPPKLPAQHKHLYSVGKSQKASCQVCYAPGAMLNPEQAPHLVPSSQQSYDMGVPMPVLQMRKLKPNKARSMTSVIHMMSGRSRIQMQPYQT